MRLVFFLRRGSRLEVTVGTDVGDALAVVFVVLGWLCLLFVAMGAVVAVVERAQRKGAEDEWR